MGLIQDQDINCVAQGVAIAVEEAELHAGTCAHYAPDVAGEGSGTGGMLGVVAGACERTNEVERDHALAGTRATLDEHDDFALLVESFACLLEDGVEDHQL